MRAPLAPMGWPRATAPPFTLTFSGLSLSWRVTAIAATAKASFSSTRSTSLSRSQPAFASSFSTASTGAIITHLGSTPLTACATMRAIGCLPRRNAVRSLVTIRAAAPSLVPGAFPAVTVPSFLNAGFSFASVSIEVSSRGDSSYLMTRGTPFFCGAAKNLRFEEAGLARANRLLMAFNGEAVLLLACDAVLFGDDFAGHAHVKVLIPVPQAVVDHGVDKLSIAEAVAGSRLLQKIGAVGHRFHAAGHYDFRFAQLDRLCRKRDGFQAGAADFVDGHRSDTRLATSLQRGLARGILAEAGLDDVAHDDFVDLPRFEIGAANGFGHDFGSEFGGGESGKATLKFADGRADGGNNHGSFGVHGGPPNRTTEERRTSL